VDERHIGSTRFTRCGTSRGRADRAFSLAHIRDADNCAGASRGGHGRRRARFTLVGRAAAKDVGETAVRSRNVEATAPCGYGKSVQSAASLTRRGPSTEGGGRLSASSPRVGTSVPAFVTDRPSDCHLAARSQGGGRSRDAAVALHEQESRDGFFPVSSGASTPSGDAGEMRATRRLTRARAPRQAVRRQAARGGSGRTAGYVGLSLAA